VQQQLEVILSLMELVIWISLKKKRKGIVLTLLAVAVAAAAVVKHLLQLQLKYQ
jgi:hypothetical protein